ncbi:MAG: hypothetical protein WAM14_14205 [Candidatus Nitrosopolaris sp.]
MTINGSYRISTELLFSCQRYGKEGKESRKVILNSSTPSNIDNDTLIDFLVKSMELANGRITINLGNGIGHTSFKSFRPKYYMFKQH